MNSQSKTQSSKSQVTVRIESFGQHHDRTTFTCGNTFIDSKLQRAVLPLHGLNFTRAFVAVEPGKTEVLGFYAMNAHAIEVYNVPLQWIHLVDQHSLGEIPAVYISLFATRERVQGRGVGSLMMADSLRRIKKASEFMGVFAVVLDAIDQKAYDFYSRLGFQGLECNVPLRMFYRVVDIP